MRTTRTSTSAPTVRTHHNFHSGDCCTQLVDGPHCPENPRSNVGGAFDACDVIEICAQLLTCYLRSTQVHIALQSLEVQALVEFHISNIIIGLAQEEKNQKTAVHSTAQRSAAQHITAQHSTAQHRAVRSTHRGKGCQAVGPGTRPIKVAPSNSECVSA